jgi:hypothetical protein
MVITRYFVLAGLLVGGSSAHAAPSDRRSGVDATVTEHADAAPATRQPGFGSSRDIMYVASTVRASTEIASAMPSITAKPPDLFSVSAVSGNLIVAEAAPAAGIGIDLGVAGASDTRWPITLDAGVRVSRTLSLTGGWGSLTTHRLSVITQLRGPRVALQFAF